MWRIRKARPQAKPRGYTHIGYDSEYKFDSEVALFEDVKKWVSSISVSASDEQGGKMMSTGGIIYTAWTGSFY